MINDNFGGKIMTEFVALGPKTYSYLVDAGSRKEQKMCNKKILKFNDYENCLLNNEIILKTQQTFKSEAHNVFNEEVNKITLSSDEDLRLQAFNTIASYPYGTIA